MRQQHHHHQLDQKCVRGAPSLILAEKSDPSSDTMNKILTNVKKVVFFVDIVKLELNFEQVSERFFVYVFSHFGSQ